MSNTLDQLRKQFATPCPSLTAVREHYFAHIRTDRHLLG
ncbi:transcriptional regulator, partial [Pseudomonas sp. GW247-3R2A]